MIDISALSKIEKNNLSSPEPWLVLLEIQLSEAMDLGQGESTTFRVVRNTEDVTWNGHLWQAFPVELDEISDAKGESPSFSVKVANVHKVMSHYLNESDGGVGSIVIIRVTHAGNTQYASNPDSVDNGDVDLELEYICTGASVDSTWATWTLGTDNIFNKRFPRNRMLKHHCRYTTNDQCEYVGSCDHTLTTCRLMPNVSNYTLIYETYKDGDQAVDADGNLLYDASNNPVLIGQRIGDYYMVNGNMVKDSYGEWTLITTPEVQKWAIGDYVYDDNGSYIYDKLGRKLIVGHRIGDPALDENGNPILNDDGDPVYVQTQNAIDDLADRFVLGTKSLSSYLSRLVGWKDINGNYFSIKSGTAVGDYKLDSEGNYTYNYVLPVDANGDFFVAANGTRNGDPILTEAGDYTTEYYEESDEERSTIYGGFPGLGSTAIYV